MEKAKTELGPDDLAEAFRAAEGPERADSAGGSKKSKKVKESNETKKPKGKKVALTIFIIGMLTLTAGIVFLVLDLIQAPKARDADYLVSVGRWILADGTNCGGAASEPISPNEAVNGSEGEAEANSNDGTESNADGEGTTNCLPSVIWNFTEIGKGTLTTNAHLNDYDFIWAIEGDTLKIETNWLYELENEYKYELDQNNGILTLTEGDQTFTFRK